MATNLASILQTLKNSVSQLPSTYQKPAYTNVIDPKVMSLADLQSQLGSSMQYDAGAIKKLYQDATSSAYESSLKQQTNSERTFWQSLSNLQNTSMDALKSTDSSAIASGTNKGMSAANQLSAILGLQQEGLTQSSDLVANRQLLASTNAAQMSQDAKDALSTSNDFQAQLATLMRQLYADQQTEQASQLAYNQSINSDSAGYAASYDTAYASLMDALSQAGSEIYGYDAAYGNGGGLSSGSGYTSGTGGVDSSAKQAEIAASVEAAMQAARANEPNQAQYTPGLTSQLRANPVSMSGGVPTLEQLVGTIPTTPETEEEKRRRRMGGGSGQHRSTAANSSLSQNAVKALTSSAAAAVVPKTVPSLPSAGITGGLTNSSNIGYLSNLQAAQAKAAASSMVPAQNLLSYSTNIGAERGVPYQPTDSLASRAVTTSGAAAAKAATKAVPAPTNKVSVSSRDMVSSKASYLQQQAAAKAAAYSKQTAAAKNKSSTAKTPAMIASKPSLASLASFNPKAAAKKKSSTAASQAARGY